MGKFAFFAGSFVAFGVILGGMLFGSPHAQPLKNVQVGAIEQANSDATKESPSVTAEKDTAKYTLYLAVLTGFLAAIAGGQLRMFVVQLRLMRVGMDDTKEAAEAAKISADAAATSARVEQESFAKLERPYVFIFNAQPHESLRPGELHPEPAAFYTVANYGKIPAIIEEVWCGYFTLSDPAIDYGPETFDHPLRSSPILAPNETRRLYRLVRPRLPIISVVDVAANERVIIPQVPPMDHLVLRVLIKYRGPFTGGHETAAYWRFDSQRCCLVQWGGPDENYER